MDASARAPGLGLTVTGELQALPGLLRALALLPLDHAAVTATVERALADNPALRRRGRRCPQCGGFRRGGRCAACPVPLPEAAPSVDPFAELEVAAGWEIRSDARHALPLVLAHLTGRGLLDAAPADIAAQHGLAPGAVDEAVRAVRIAGPPGIAERTVTDLLVAQARALVAAGRAPALLPDLVRHHLPAVADGDLAGPAQALGVTASRVAELVELVRTRLRPSVATGGDPPVRAVPDVLVRREPDGAMTVEVADSRWFGLSVVPAPARVRADVDAAAWLRVHERAAAELIRQLDVRASVLRQVALAAVAHQSGYLRHGPAAHRDLTRADVAAALGLHPSTVSRAVAGKVLRHPDGTVTDLAVLFGTAVPVKARIAVLAVGGSLSDERLRHLLAAEGHDLARRTVAKYRAELGLPAAGRRRS